MSKSDWWKVALIIFLGAIAFYPRSIVYEDAKKLKSLYPYLQDISMSGVIGCWRGDTGRLYAERCHLNADVDQSMVMPRLLNEGWAKTNRPDFGGELSFSWCRGSAQINSGKYGERWVLEYIETTYQQC